MARERELPPEPVEEAPPKPKGKMKKIILLAVVAVVVLVGAALAYIAFIDDPSPQLAEQAKLAEKAIMPLEPFLVNLADKDARRYLKVKIDLEVDNEKAIKELEKSLPRIRDQLIFLLSSKSYQEIATPEGKHQLKKEIMARLGGTPTGKKITGAFFTEFVAQ